MKRVCVVAILLCGAAVGVAHAGAIIIDHNCVDLSVIPEDSVTAAASLRLLLRHASVGQGIGWGLDCMAGLKPTNASCKCFTPGEYDRTNWVLEARMGDGRSKIDDLVAQTNTRAGEFDVFTMKYCYIDALGDHHPDWEYYRTQMEQLEAQYPGKHFVWWTIPLTRDGQPGTDAFNALVRSYCAANGKILFDIADIECHDPSGVKQTNAQGNETICQDYTKEIHAGHLNVEGRIRVASALWRLMAAIADDEPPATDAHTIIYVDDDANSPGDGSSWETAYKFLQDALADAESAEKPVEIRVAQGVYQPDRSSANPEGTRDKRVKFCLVDGVTLRGGFAGCRATEPSAHDAILYETVLSGDLDGDDTDVSDEATRQENSRTVVEISGAAGLRDLTVCGGHHFLFWGKPYEAMDANGGAVRILNGDVTIYNCRFQSNYAQGGGGAVYNRSSGRVVLERCLFEGNLAGGGGGVCTFGADIELIDCEFRRNRGVSGGAFTLFRYLREIPSVAARLVRCTFSENQALAGGAIANESEASLELDSSHIVGNVAREFGGAVTNGPKGVLVLRGCLLCGNTADDGGVLWVGEDSTTRVLNCTVWANRARASGFLSDDYRLPGIPPPSRSAVEIVNSLVSSESHREIRMATTSVSIRYSRLKQGNQYIYDPYGKLPWGPGNTDADPCFVDPGSWDPNGTLDDPDDDFFVEGDYRLKSQAGRWDPVSQSWITDDVTSPCIDTGDPNSPVGDEPFPNGGRINMGAYGGTSEASKSPFGG